MPFFRSQTIALAIATFAASSVKAEIHTVSFASHCTTGTPTLQLDNTAFSFQSGEKYVYDGPINNAHVYLQNGACGFGGSNCTTVEFTLSNGDSSARLFYLDPYGYNVPVGFEYYHGCDGERYECLPSAAPCGNPPVLTCSANDVNLHFNFCS